MRCQEVFDRVSKDLGIPVEIIKETYDSYWKFIRSSIQELPLKEDLSEEEFGKLRTNFNIPSIGKLSCTYDRMIRLKRMYNNLREIRNGNKHKED
jgi:hypothetical protein